MNQQKAQSYVANLLILLIATVVMQSNRLEAQDWMQFRGKGGTATSVDADLPIKWNANSNIKWKTELPGPGASSPIIVGDRVFLTCYSGYGDKSKGKIEDLKRHLLCFNRVSGEIQWQKSFDNSSIEDEDPYESFITNHGYATNTPVSDGKAVYFFLGKLGLFAFDLDGKQLWKKEIEYKTNKTRWGSAASPVLFGDHLILNAIEECGKVFSIAKTDGEIHWEFSADTQLAYATPGLVTASDGDVELVLPVPKRVIGLDPIDGTQKWYATNRFEGESNASVIVDNDVVYIYGGFRSVGSMAVRVGGKGNVTESHVLWKTRDTAYVSTPILNGKHLYWIDEKGIAYCVQAESGERIYRNRVAGVKGGRGIKFFASMVSAGDHMFAVSRSSGTFVIKTAPKYELVSHNKIEGDDSEFNGTPAISGNQLFIRSNKFLYCIGK